MEKKSVQMHGNGYVDTVGGVGGMAAWDGAIQLQWLHLALMT